MNANHIMKIELSAPAPLEFDTPCLVVPLFQGEESSGAAASVDGSLSAHFEHIVAILSDGPEILTCVD